MKNTIIYTASTAALVSIAPACATIDAQVRFDVQTGTYSASREIQYAPYEEACRAHPPEIKAMRAIAAIRLGDAHYKRTQEGNAVLVQGGFNPQDIRHVIEFTRVCAAVQSLDPEGIVRREGVEAAAAVTLEDYFKKK